MLEIKDISKQYVTGPLVQQALNHVSLNLRDNEFVAILGPSGSGKTTLLNIIGGLDRYDSGDLVINGISTKQYKDRDWDSYRNHTIGFVFQSYNLIPHQTILSNVELALTISGISRSERKERALEALEKVGLGEHVHKKPNQLSGGQMQRVAIARALVNDPDILLADEPTGALDSETSVQVMDLLQEVADDRLVVMVTHNPELAEEYATRIVRLKDGVIIDDSDPYIIENSQEAIHKNMGKSSMSFLTALSLSFNNLRTKLTRTILVSFAGSIGIIGIAAILSLSNGVNDYIRTIEESTLSEYPLQIMSSAFDFTSMMVASADVSQEAEEEEVKQEAEVKERPMVSGILSRSTSNDLKSLKVYLDNSGEIKQYTNAIEYSYSLEPQIYRLDADDYRKINPDSSFSSLGFGGSNNSLMQMAMSTNIFYSLPTEENLYINQYDVKAGRWPTKYNECVLVLTQSGGVSDFVLYSIGLKDSDELDNLIESFANEEKIDFEIKRKDYNYKDFIGLKFKLVTSADYFQYDKEYDVYVDKSNDSKYMMNLLRNSEDLEIVGVVMRKEDSDIGMLTMGINYHPNLIPYISKLSNEKDVTIKQLNNKHLNVFTGKDFGDDSENDFDMDSLMDIDSSALENVIKFDTSKLKFDTTAFGNMDFSGMDFSNISFDPSSSVSMDINTIISQINLKTYPENTRDALESLMNNYLTYAAKDPTTDYRKIPETVSQYLEQPETQQLLGEEIRKLIEKTGFLDITTGQMQQLITTVMTGYPEFIMANPELAGNELLDNLPLYLQSDIGTAKIQEALGELSTMISLDEIKQEDIEALLKVIGEDYQRYVKENQMPDTDKLEASFSEFLKTTEGQKALTASVEKVIDVNDLRNQVNSIMAKSGQAYAGMMQEVMGKVMQQIGTTMATSVQNSMSSFAQQIPNAITFDASAFSRAFNFKMDAQDLEDLMVSMMSSQMDTYDNNLARLGYADLSVPYMISIYPKDFETKEEVIRILDEYNAKMELEDEEKVISYTDTVGTLMSSVTDIIDTISYVLIAFVAISLVVSSIMIGVITYISVLERNKEIGILRAIGASKRNISQVFNAETFIIGLLAGLFGIGITRLLLIPGNYLIHHISGNYSVNAFLPWKAGVILVILSVILTLIGGIIPSRKAAKSDPVTALRTE